MKFIVLFIIISVFILLLINSYTKLTNEVENFDTTIDIDKITNLVQTLFDKYLLLRYNINIINQQRNIIDKNNFSRSTNEQLNIEINQSNNRIIHFINIVKQFIIKIDKIIQIYKIKSIYLTPTNKQKFDNMKLKLNNIINNLHIIKNN